jgi:pyrroline-5-carboxylate reductase
LEELKTEEFKDKIFISIMAGIPLNVLKTHIRGERLSFVRTMPNTPLLVGKGITGVFTEDNTLYTIVEVLIIKII